MTLKSIEKLRGIVQKAFDAGNLAYDPGNRIMDGLREIEREIAERFIELPLDADGVPIRVGDTVEYPNGSRDVVRFITVNDNEPTFNEMGWISGKCRHAKPRTIEDVLQCAGVSVAAIEDVAAEIRELMGVES